MIRPARYEDLLKIEKLVFEFHEESLKEYLSFDSKTIRQTILDYIDKYIMLVDDELTGVIAGIVAPSVFDSKDIIAQESIWYISKTQRKGRLWIELLTAFEDKARELKATKIIMIHMDNLNGNLMEKLYTHRGYKRLEWNFIRDIKEVANESLA